MEKMKINDRLLRSKDKPEGARKPSQGSNTQNFSCSCCGYTSKRLFNILRHEQRIHSVLEKPKRCCGEKFLTKGQFYLHVEKVHPANRRNAKVSRNKFKILRSMPTISTITKETNDDVGPSKNLRKRNDNVDFDDIPLSYFLKNPHRITMKKRQTSAEQVDSKISDSTTRDMTMLELDVETCQPESTDDYLTIQDWQQDVLPQYSSIDDYQYWDPESSFTTVTVGNQDGVNEDSNFDRATLVPENNSSATLSSSPSPDGTQIVLNVSQDIPSFSGKSESSEAQTEISTVSSVLPLKTRILNERLPFKKRCIKPLENVTNVLQPRLTVNDENAPKEKHVTKTKLLDTKVNNENESPRDNNVEASINVNFRNIMNLPVITEHVRNFLLYVDFDKLKGSSIR